MKFNSSSQVEMLAKIKTHPYQATSFYLNTDKSQQSRKAINAAYKTLLNQARMALEKADLSKEQKKSLLDDLEKIAQFCTLKLNSWKAPGLALFSCSGQNFWQELELPHGPRNRIVQDFDFYTRPLAAILEKYKKTCVFLINRKKAVWYEVFLGEIKLLDTLESNVPKQVKKGGFEGYEAKKIERHIEAMLLEHFKKAASRTFEILKQNNFNWLLVGCDNQYYPQIEEHFHTYVRNKLAGRLKARPDTEPSKILKECLEIEDKLKKKEDEEFVKNFISELESGGRAVSGLADTLRRLNSFEVQAILVTHNFSKPGKVCPGCHRLFLNEEVCPNCKMKTEEVADVVDEALELAMGRNIPVYQITPPSRLDHYGNIGAFLKFKPKE
ncbi:MAG: hypothetical protein H5U07_01980 [Candidatus Aminicenantes bacterium]|nr:hypothetical protein [Candidatus Aminicenantes bacterium]